MKKFGGIALGLKLGNLGFKIKGVKAEQVFDDPSYFKEIFKRNKVIGFIGMRPTDLEHMQLVDCLYRGIRDEDFSGGLLAGQRHETVLNVEDKTDPEGFLKRNWHVDNPFMPEPPCLVSIHMTTYKVDPDYGHTFFVSLANLYNDCPAHIKEHLETARFVCQTGAIDQDVSTHPALRTHPDTGETMLYWTGPGTALAGGNTPWFDELYDWVSDYCANEANRFKWTWSEGDVIIWDNRAVMHGFYNGWDRSERIFQRVEVGNEAPFFDLNHEGNLDPAFGDTNEYKGVAKDRSKGPNPDHIPLVFTKGIYALEGLEHLFQKVTLFVFSKDGSVPQKVQEFKAFIDETDELSDDFHVVGVPIDENDRVFVNLMRYSKHHNVEDPVEGQMFLFSRNGDTHGGSMPARQDLMQTKSNEDGSLTPIENVRAYLRWHPDMRHAGHAWHYPDWFPHQPLQYRPWDFHNLSFMTYEGFNGKNPPEDFLVQFAIDTIYGCFNHLKDNGERRRIIERINDYISYMLELDEHEFER